MAMYYLDSRKNAAWIAFTASLARSARIRQDRLISDVLMTSMLIPAPDRAPNILAAMPQDMTYVLEIPNDPVCAEIGFEGWARHILQTAQQHLDTDLAPKTNTRQETTA